MNIVPRQCRGFFTPVRNRQYSKRNGSSALKKRPHIFCSALLIGSYEQSLNFKKGTPAGKPLPSCVYWAAPVSGGLSSWLPLSLFSAPTLSPRMLR